MEKKIIFGLNGNILYECETDTFKTAFETAVKKRIDLSYADLKGKDLSNIIADGAILDHSDLSGCDFTNSEFLYSNLSYCLMKESRIINTNLSFAAMAHSDLTSSKINYSVLSRCNLTSSIMSKCEISNCNFSDSSMYGSISDNMTSILVNYTRTKMLDCSLCNSSFKNCNMREAIMGHTKLNGVSFDSECRF